MLAQRLAGASVSYTGNWKVSFFLPPQEYCLWGVKKQFVHVSSTKMDDLLSTQMKGVRIQNHLNATDTQR